MTDKEDYFGVQKIKLKLDENTTLTSWFLGIVGSLEPLSTDKLVSSLFAQLDIIADSLADAFLGGFGDGVGFVKVFELSCACACGCCRGGFAVTVLVVMKSTACSSCSSTGARAKGSLLHGGWLIFV